MTRLLPAARTLPALALFASLPVLALPDDPVNLVAGLSVAHDSNFFRLADGVQPNINGRQSRSETLTSVYGGVRVDKAYSLQRFQLDLTGTRYEYQNNDFLSFTGFNYRAAWLWALTPYLTGTLSSDRTQAPVSYADFNSDPNTASIISRRNQQTVHTHRFGADWWLGGAWHVVGAAYQVRSNNNGNFTAVGDFRENTGELGARYVTAANNSLSLIQRESQGDYQNRALDAASRIDTAYTQRETELRGVWRATGHTSFDGKISWVKREHEHFADRDFQGAIGSLNTLWSPTGKLQVSLTAGRNLNTYVINNAAFPSSYYVANYINLTPTWIVTDKTSLRLSLQADQRDFKGATVAGPQRQDTQRTALIGATWRPTRTVDIDTYLARETRHSNIDGFTYDNNAVGVAAKLAF